jgi:release factor glutamine methyltransferase
MLSSGFVGKKAAKLPLLDHLTMEDFENVYEPSDDTFLLCDAIENDRAHLSSTKPEIVLEVGCGSGCVITFLSMLLKEEGIPAISLATDINPIAAACALRTAKANDIQLDVVLTNLVAAIHERLYHKVDVLLFNPPYVPTPSEEIGK